MRTLLYLFCAVMFFSCSKDEEEGAAITLPPPTSTGKNTLGCLINGEPFIPGGGTVLGTPDTPVLAAQYFYVPPGLGFVPGYNFSIRAYNNHLACGITIQLQTSEVPFEVGRIYPITVNQGSNLNAKYYFHTNKPHPEQGGAFIIETHTSVTTDETTGEMTFTKIDEANHIIAGTFSFDSVDAETNTITKIRNGRFDLVYDPSF